MKAIVYSNIKIKDKEIRKWKQLTQLNLKR